MNQNRSKYLILVLLKNIFLIFGVNILLTTLITVIKLEFKKNNFDSEINLNYKKLKYVQNIQFNVDIY